MSTLSTHKYLYVEIYRTFRHNALYVSKLLTLPIQDNQLDPGFKNEFAAKILTPAA